MDTRGAFSKFEVTRMDGRDGPGEKHEECAYFVLDLDHDEHARAAMRAYAESCRGSHHALSDDIETALRESDYAACGCREAHCEHEPFFGWPSLGEAFARKMLEADA